MLHISHRDDDSNEEVGEDEVAEEDEHNGEELASSVSLGGQAVLEVCPAISLCGWWVPVFHACMCMYVYVCVCMYVYVGDCCMHVCVRVHVHVRTCVL